jgi:hypothetical protein
MNLNFGYDPASHDSLVIICTKDVYFQRFGINRIKRVSRKIKKRWIEWIESSIVENNIRKEIKDAFLENRRLPQQKAEVEKQIKLCDKRLGEALGKGEDFDAQWEIIHLANLSMYRPFRISIKLLYHSVKERIYKSTWKERRNWVKWIVGSLEVNDMIQRRKDWHRIRKSHYIYFSDKITVSTTDIPPIIANVKIDDKQIQEEKEGTICPKCKKEMKTSFTSLYKEFGQICKSCFDIEQDGFWIKRMSGLK